MQCFLLGCQVAMVIFIIEEGLLHDFSATVPLLAECG